MICALAVSVAVPMSRASHAQEVDCTDPQTQLALNVCADHELQTAETELDARYKALSDKVSDAGRESLERARAAFNAYREAQCAFDTAGTEGGSIHPMMVAQCSTALTNAQIAVVEAQLNCEEGDPACGGQ